MKIKSIMSRDVASCSPDATLYEAARIMWDHDCGAVPVVDAETQRLQGIVTDRDVCMAALLSNRPVPSIPVREVMRSDVLTCHEGDSVSSVHDTMRENQVRRVPVVDDDEHVVGMVSLHGLAREAFECRSAAAARRQKAVAKTLSEVCYRPDTNGEEEEQLAGY